LAYSYKVSDGLAVASKMVKSIPLAGIDVTVCDMVSSRMWNAFVWRERVANIPLPGTLLVDGVQDYNVPVNFHTMLRARITRTDTTPDYSVNLEPTEHLEPELRKQPWTGIRLISHEPDLGMLRLDSAVQVTSPAVLRLNGEYLVQATKITATSQGLWMKDEYLDVYAKGLAYWAYKLADDPRAGSSSTDGEGRKLYSGMMGEWMDGIMEMRQSEDFAALPQLFPDDSMGAYSYNASFIFP
jgi:hypothetical protein